MKHFQTSKKADIKIENSPYNVPQLRIDLDFFNENNASVRKRMWKLERVLAQKRRPFFLYDCTDGILDITRITQVIANPLKLDYYKQLKKGEVPESCITFVLDSTCFSSISIQEEIVSAIDMSIKMLERTDISSEIYSNDEDGLVVFKTNHEKWQKSRNKIALMLKEEAQYMADWDLVIKSLILNKKKYHEENQLLIFITADRVYNFNTHLFAMRNKVKYEQLDIKDVQSSENIGVAIVKKISEAFGIKSKH